MNIFRRLGWGKRKRLEQKRREAVDGDKRCVMEVIKLNGLYYTPIGFVYEYNPRGHTSLGHALIELLDEGRIAHTGTDNWDEFKATGVAA